MVIKNIDFEKYNKMAEKSFYRKLGKVVNVVGLTIESAGPDSKLGDLCRILPDAEGARPIMAEVVGFRDKKTLLMPYDSVDGIGLGCVVENTGDALKVTVNDKLLGKTVNGLGVPIDGEMINGAAYPVEAAPPDPMSRTIIDQVLPLGVKAVDGMITVGKGQRIGIFAGSGVGKSTLLNALLPDAARETSAISQKLGRGRHTTREVTIFEAYGGRIADTPGFASLEANRAGFIPKENLEHAFPEFGPYLGQCQFTGCSHRSEKGCAVREALAEGKLSKTRYDSYCAMYDEVKDVKDWQRPKV